MFVCRSVLLSAGLSVFQISERVTQRDSLCEVEWVHVFEWIRYEHVCHGVAQRDSLCESEWEWLTVCESDVCWYRIHRGTQCENQSFEWIRYEHMCHGVCSEGLTVWSRARVTDCVNQNQQHICWYRIHRGTHCENQSDSLWDSEWVRENQREFVRNRVSSCLWVNRICVTGLCISLSEITGLFCKRAL